MASELTAWMQMLALDSPARAREPKRLRLRLFSATGRMVRGAPAAAAHRRHLALGHPDHHRDHPPASLRPRLTPTKSPRDQKDKPRAHGTPRPPGATAGQPATPAR